MTSDASPKVKCSPDKAVAQEQDLTEKGRLVGQPVLSQADAISVAQLAEGIAAARSVAAAVGQLNESQDRERKGGSESSTVNSEHRTTNDNEYYAREPQESTDDSRTDLRTRDRHHSRYDVYRQLDAMAGQSHR